jgi:hypothetical protein
MRHWDAEIAGIEKHARHLATHHKANAVIAVAVDDNDKRDYFVPRLQTILAENTWARYITFRVVPMVGQTIELKIKDEPT